MKIQLFILAAAYSTASAFLPTSSPQKMLTFLQANVNSMWAFDAYGRADGELPAPEIMYGEGDPWYFNPNGGITQSDFYPAEHAGNRLTTSSRSSEVSTPPAPATSAPAKSLPDAEKEIAMPNKEVAMPDLDSSTSVYEKANSQTSS